MMRVRVGVMVGVRVREVVIAADNSEGFIPPQLVLQHQRG